MRRVPVLLGAAVLTAALAVTAGAVALRSDTTARANPAADRAAVLRNVGGGTGASIRGDFDTLVAMLPNATHGNSRATVSDSVVVGTITGMTKHTGVRDVWPPPGVDGDARNEMVPFDSPLADWRNLKITVTVSEVLAGPEVTTLVFDWTAGVAEDVDAIGRALKDLGTVMVISRPYGANTMGLTRALSDPTAALLQIGADGRLSFPLTAAGEGAALQTARADAAFTDGLDTLAEVRDAARKPTWAAPRASHFPTG
ncbi:MAG: hypothetical protein M3P04_14825 [Actinomycetota bacterium]|nr:hypothetical protein [Actinomycetota bacterium]